MCAWLTLCCEARVCEVFYVSSIALCLFRGGPHPVAIELQLQPNEFVRDEPPHVFAASQGYTQ